MNKMVVIIYFVGLAFLCYLFFAAYSSIKDAEKKDKIKKEAAQKES